MTCCDDIRCEECGKGDEEDKIHMTPQFLATKKNHALGIFFV